MAITLEQRCENIRTLVDMAVLDTIRAGTGDDPRMLMVSNLVAVREALLAVMRDDHRYAEYCATMTAMTRGHLSADAHAAPTNVRPFPATRRG